MRSASCLPQSPNPREGSKLNNTTSHQNRTRVRQQPSEFTILSSHWQVCAVCLCVMRIGLLTVPLISCIIQVVVPLRLPISSTLVAGEIRCKSTTRRRRVVTTDKGRVNCEGWLRLNEKSALSLSPGYLAGFACQQHSSYVHQAITARWGM